ncbi:uncharacterized protein N7482_008090 [Penicillium canariense]|uniref:Uncharacterized protein n=1 Tax=Penicillium canariense TaxID=189055 RepID=A0A9W9HVM0_9EURO|nr:uncharacterized protein N7482_008090 [Penicillium canariense]KAJ5156990.1 hypothetical protein N7482_008090 [Penicillium canariense]
MCSIGGCCPHRDPSPRPYGDELVCAIASTRGTNHSILDHLEHPNGPNIQDRLNLGLSAPAADPTRQTVSSNASSLRRRHGDWTLSQQTLSCDVNRQSVGSSVPQAPRSTVSKGTPRAPKPTGMQLRLVVAPRATPPTPPIIAGWPPLIRRACWAPPLGHH